MKKTLLLCGIMICCVAGFAMALTGNLVKNHSAVTPPAKKTAKVISKKPFTVTVTLSGTGGSTYRIIFHNSSYDHTFPMPYNTPTQISVPSGVYLVAILPAIPGPGSGTHSFSGLACAVTFSASGTMAQFNNVDLTCNNTASFSMN
ncbi:MAG TPA: hypothetical protein VGC01_11205 [Mucilaginibacter sp.]